MSQCVSDLEFRTEWPVFTAVCVAPYLIPESLIPLCSVFFFFFLFFSLDDC